MVRRLYEPVRRMYLEAGKKAVVSDLGRGWEGGTRTKRWTNHPAKRDPADPVMDDGSRMRPDRRASSISTDSSGECRTKDGNGCTHRSLIRCILSTLR